MIGAKGVPAHIGGVERIVEELGARLAARGHQITVYCRRDYGGGAEPAGHRGMRLRWISAISGKHTGAISHAFLSFADAVRRPFDVLHFHGLGTAPVALLAWLAGARVLFHIHGQEWRGGKWGRLARAYFKGCEAPAMDFSHQIVVDTRALEDYYRAMYGRETVYIPNATEIPEVRETGILARHNLSPRDYLLFVGRLVPEKGLHHLIGAARRLHLDRPVVVVGESSHSDAYVAEIRASAPPFFRFAGRLDAAELAELYARSLLLVHPSEREGMSVVLLEAMSLGACVLASDIPEMVETLGGCGHHFRSGDVEDLARVLGRLLDDPAAVDAVRAPARERVRTCYSWEPVTDRFEALYRRMAGTDAR
jgi:glycosyltransferase involved in cell wall biosynthesis